MDDMEAIKNNKRPTEIDLDALEDGFARWYVHQELTRAYNEIENGTADTMELGEVIKGFNKRHGIKSI
jgi:hypothetical protein